MRSAPCPRRPGLRSATRGAGAPRRAPGAVSAPRSIGPRSRRTPCSKTPSNEKLPGARRGVPRSSGNDGAPRTAVGAPSSAPTAVGRGAARSLNGEDGRPGSAGCAGGSGLLGRGVRERAGLLSAGREQREEHLVRLLHLSVVTFHVLGNCQSVQNAHH